MKKELTNWVFAFLLMFSLPYNAFADVDKNIAFEGDRVFEELRSIHVMPVKGTINGSTIQLTFCENLWDVTVNIKDEAGIVLDTYFLDEVQYNAIFRISLDGNQPGEYTIEVITESDNIHGDFNIE